VLSGVTDEGSTESGSLIDEIVREASDHTLSMSARWRQPLPLIGTLAMRLAHSQRQERAFLAPTCHTVKVRQQEYCDLCPGG
jgi:hypothetical protein